MSGIISLIGLGLRGDLKFVGAWLIDYIELRKSLIQICLSDDFENLTLKLNFYFYKLITFYKIIEPQIAALFGVLIKNSFYL